MLIRLIERLFGIDPGARPLPGAPAARPGPVPPRLLAERPALCSLAYALERLSLALLVGASLFVFFTGVLNIQMYYAFGFGFVSAHYYGTFIFLAALIFHVEVKLPDIARAFRERGCSRRCARIAPRCGPSRRVQRERSDRSARGHDLAPRVRRRGRPRLGRARADGRRPVDRRAAAAARIARPPRAPLRHGAQRLSGQQTATAAGITPAQTGSRWRLELEGARMLELSRDDLMTLPLSTWKLPIACVEGWSTNADVDRRAAARPRASRRR